MLRSSAPRYSVSLVIVWYATSGYHPDDVTARREAEPWYGRKTEPSIEDIITNFAKR